MAIEAHSAFRIPTSAFPRVAILGGGLAGLAAAVALVERGCRVDLLEARRTLGGRAGAFVDPESGEAVDHCQHVGMGCCTNWLDLCRRTGLDRFLRRDRTVHFFGPGAQRCDFAATPGLPAPLHLGAAFLAMEWLLLEDRLATSKLLLRLASEASADSTSAPTIGAWLAREGASPQAIDQFWAVVLVSALGETLDRASLAAARKVFVDGFLAHEEAFELVVPTVPLGRLYDVELALWLRERGVKLHLGTAVEQLTVDIEGRRVTGLRTADGEIIPCDQAIIAVPWRRVADLIPPELAARMPALAGLEQIAASPISAAHLWFDRRWFELDHGVLIGRLAQWLFARPHRDGQYCQIVISASRSLAGRTSDDVIAELLRELHEVWPQSRDARLLRSRLVTQREAVFSCVPGLDDLRPPQATPIANLFLAGDWTRTGWPATMEGAVRSGYLAAECVLRASSRPAEILQPDLPRGWLARWMIGN